MTDQLKASLYKEYQSIPTLSEKHLEGSTVLPNRDHVLNKLPKGGICVEIGTYRGDYAQKILDIIKPDKLYLLDVNCSFVKERFKKEIESGKVIYLEGYSNDLVDLVPNEIDFLYIDADHSYEGVSTDLKLYEPKVKDNGYIGLNDYILLDWVSQTTYGVKRAIHEFCIDHNWKWAYLALAPCDFRDVVLTRIKN